MTPAPSVRQEPFGEASDGTPVRRWILTAGDREASILTYGAVLQSLHVPDREGRPDNVVLGLPTMAEYIADEAYLGAIVGRYANRIARGSFELDGETFVLPANDRGNTLHGGPDGFHRQVWASAGHTDETHASVRLRLHSPHMHMGFPGALVVEVTYSLATDGTLAVDYQATTDRPTVVNLTQHAYWNLEGEKADLSGHHLAVHADAYLPVDTTAIPHGDPAPVAGTPFDFTTATPLIEPIRAEHPQIAAAGGVDHCFVLRPATDTRGLRRAACLDAPASGRRLEVRTTEPGIQVYTSNALGPPFRRHAAVCLETQNFPDAPNRSAYPSPVLRPGRTHRSRTEFRFTTAGTAGTATTATTG